jgi:hypothetical protein
MATLASRWNIFDAVIIAMSAVLQLLKVISDYAVIHAPHPPVMKLADSNTHTHMKLADSNIYKYTHTHTHTHTLLK